MWSPISSTLIYGKRDAVLVDTFITVEQAYVLVEWVKASGKNLTAIYITHGKLRRPLIQPARRTPILICWLTLTGNLRPDLIFVFEQRPELFSLAPWVEAFLPGLGWVAVDPTNNLVGGERHIRVAIGRDYADLPRTRGVYKGEAESGLSVSVTVSSADAPRPEELPPLTVVRSRPARLKDLQELQHEQQQQ